MYHLMQKNKENLLNIDFPWSKLRQLDQVKIFYNDPHLDETQQYFE